MPVLPDILAPGLRVVFCGTASAEASARVGHYYAGPVNRFWRTLHEIGLTGDRVLTPAEFESLPRYGIGLTDLAKHAVGTDDRINAADFALDDLRRKILNHMPRILAFNGKNAAKGFLNRRVDYGLQPERIESTEVFVLPSTSAAARRYWDLNPWRQLASRLTTTPPPPHDANTSLADSDSS
jgi:TDG/mug DNA glycosylase family protein